MSAVSSPTQARTWLIVCAWGNRQSVVSDQGVGKPEGRVRENVLVYKAPQRQVGHNESGEAMQGRPEGPRVRAIEEATTPQSPIDILPHSMKASCTWLEQI